MIRAEDALSLLEQRYKELRQAQEFYWFILSSTEAKGLKEADIEELIREHAKNGCKYVNIYRYKITDLGKQKLKEYGYTVVDVFNYQWRTIPLTRFLDMPPNYVICLDYSFAMEVVNHFVTQESIKRESIKVY